MHILKSINEYIGRYISWLIIIMVIVQIVTVLSRYVFGLGFIKLQELMIYICLLYTSPSPRDQRGSRMPSSA